MSEQLISLGEWQALGLRLTAFPDPSASVPNEGWWEATVGQPPEEISRRRTGEVRETGPFGAGQLVLSIDPLRIDWRFLPLEEENVLPEELLTLGTFSQTLDVFLPLMPKWLEAHCPELQRLAFGADLVIPAQDHPDAYIKLSTYLPNVKLDPEGSYDFNYRINRPRLSQVVGSSLRINRLAKWSALKFSRQVILSSERVLQFPGIYRYYCRAELDINTALEFEGVLSREQLPAIFQELVDLGQEIAVKGDIP